MITIQRKEIRHGKMRLSISRERDDKIEFGKDVAILTKQNGLRIKIHGPIQIKRG